VLARIEPIGGGSAKIRLLVQHETRKRLDFAVQETLAAISRRGISVAEFDERETRPWWIGGRKTWVTRLTLMGDPPADLAPALAEELGARGYRVTISAAARVEFFGA